METPTLQEFEEARERISGAAVRTPLVQLHESSGVSDVFLKLETHQPINSFKIRGIFNAVARLRPDERSRGLFTTSAGNTAQAIAWCGRHFGVAARSMMPHGAPTSKAEAVRAYGGEPVFVSTDELFGYMRNHDWEGQDYAFIHPWTNRDVLIGHGSCGIEIAEDLPQTGAVYIPVGGGGFFCGVALALRAVLPNVKIIAVEPEGCPALTNSLAAGRAVAVDCHTFCDGVAVPYMTDENFPLLRDLADDCVLIREEEVFDAIRLLASGNKVIAEGAGALAVAAALRLAGDHPGPAVAIVTGGSIDQEIFLSILEGRTEPF